MFWGILTPKLYFLSSRPPKGTSLRRNVRFEPSFNVFSPTVWSGCDAKCTKKERTKSKPKFAIFADPLPVVPHQPNFACQNVSRISFLVLSFKKIGWKMWEEWGWNFWLSHWLGTSPIQQLLAIAQAMKTGWTFTLTVLREWHHFIPTVTITTDHMHYIVRKLLCCTV